MASAPDDPLRIALSPAGVAARQAACAPSSPVRLGLLLNPNAGRSGHAARRHRLQALLSETDAWDETWDLASIRRALARLLCLRGANILAIAGGDGTVHHTVNALVELTQQAAEATGLEVPLPRLLILNGGTLNIVGRTCAIHGPPEEILQKFMSYFGGARLSRVPARRLPLLEVAWLDQGRAILPRLGFVFGSEVAYHAIALYERFGAGYLGLARFLAEMSRGILVGSELWQREGWKLGPYDSELVVDGQRWSSYIGVAASTVDLTLAIGAARAIRRNLYQPGMSCRVVEAMAPREVVRLLPAMMSDKPIAGLRDFPTARQVDLVGPYTLDGELVHEPAPLPHRLPLRVRCSDVRLHAVPGEWTADDW